MVPCSRTSFLGFVQRSLELRADLRELGDLRVVSGAEAAKRHVEHATERDQILEGIDWDRSVVGHALMEAPASVPRQGVARTFSVAISRLAQLMKRPRLRQSRVEQAGDARL